MGKFRYRLYQFMQGRRGIDQFGRFLIMSVGILMLLSMLFRGSPTIYRIVYYTSIVVLVYSYFRMMSRNIYKRQQENSRYLSIVEKFTHRKTFNERRHEREAYSFFKCPTCGQKMRAPKGRGTIRVTCNRCGNEFKRNV